MRGRQRTGDNCLILVNSPGELSTLEDDTIADCKPTIRSMEAVRISKPSEKQDHSLPQLIPLGSDRFPPDPSFEGVVYKWGPACRFVQTIR